MMSSRPKGLVGIVVAAALMFSSTGAVAATSRAPVQQINPWAVLAVMSGTAPTAVLCGAAAAAAAASQPAVGCVLPVTGNVPPPVAASEPPLPIPVPPVEAAGAGLGISPLLLALGALAAGVGLYLLLKKNSPA
jgi:hypothetical protein